MGERTLKAATGVEGLDAVLSGGLTRSRVFLLEGSPGTGKTTIATQFLLEGANRCERFRLGHYAWWQPVRAPQRFPRRRRQRRPHRAE